MQSAGEIRRISTNGCLDTQRYRYALWRPNPLDKLKLTPEDALIELARRFFRWIGPATRAEFQWFSGLGVKASQAAIKPLKLVPIDKTSDRVMFADDLEQLRAFKPPKQPRYVLASCLDAISAHRRDVKGLLDQKDWDRNVAVEKSLQPVGGVMDLPSHAILDRGRLIGLWEYDADSQSIAWASFIPADKPLRAAVERMEDYVRDQLGDARSFSLDSPKSRAPRIAALRRLR